MFEELGMFVRFARELRGFLGTQLNESDCLRLVRDHLDNRRDRFLDILRFGVFQNPQSPYRRLLEHAGLALSDVTAMVDRSGIEGALEELYERGVYLTLDEFKTRTPIRRAGLEFTIRPCDLDNSLIAGHYESKTGGSRGTRTRLLIDLDLLAHEAAHTFLLYSEFGLTGRPAAIWRELPPEIVGLKTFLRHAKLGRPIAKWFNHRKRISHPEDLKFYLFTLATRCLARMYGSPMPPFENVALSDVRRVAQWLADMKRQGSPALLDTNPSTGVRVCLAAKENNWDIAGTFFRFSAEPYTDARARIVHEAGCRAASHYSASEAGHIGLACGDAQGVDEVHIMADKVGVIQRHKEVGQSGCSVGSLLITTVSPSCPKMMLNVELGDYGILEHRRCGCLLDELGLHLHLRQIRSFEKLNSEGMTFLGTHVISLLEEVLPERYGGSPLDYQLLEDEEENGLPKVSLVISPEIPDINEQAVVDTVLEQLSSQGPSGIMMTDVWRNLQTLRIIRHKPYSTRALKLLPLHILGASRGK